MSRQTRIHGIPVTVVTDDEITPDVLLMCVRVADLPQPPVPSTSFNCGICDRAVWASDASTVPLIERGRMVVCVQCATAMEESPASPV